MHKIHVDMFKWSGKNDDDSIESIEMSYDHYRIVYISTQFSGKSDIIIYVFSFVEIKLTSILFFDLMMDIYLKFYFTESI